MVRGWRLLPPPPRLPWVGIWPSFNEVKGGPNLLEPEAVATTARFGPGESGVGCWAFKGSETITDAKTILLRQTSRTLFMVLILVFQENKTTEKLKPGINNYSPDPSLFCRFKVVSARLPESSRAGAGIYLVPDQAMPFSPGIGGCCI
jgi:hypothetical protein